MSPASGRVDSSASLTPHTPVPKSPPVSLACPLPPTLGGVGGPQGLSPSPTPQAGQSLGTIPQPHISGGGRVCLGVPRSVPQPKAEAVPRDTPGQERSPRLSPAPQPQLRESSGLS